MSNYLLISTPIVVLADTLDNTMQKRGPEDAFI